MMQPLLELRNVSKQFGAVKAVAGVNLDITEGRVHSIIGPNGAGKTTLFNCISGELPPSSGEILFGGVKIQGKPPHELASLRIARSFQKTSIFPKLTVAQNVWMSAFRKEAGKGIELFRRADFRGEVTELVTSALARTGLSRHANAPAITLSHGDRRLLDLTIALAPNPRLLLLDEPAAGLSAAETQRVMQLIETLKTLHTVLLIEHKMDVVMRISDRITVMHLGRVIAEGRPDEVRSNETVRAAYLGWAA